MESFDEMEKYYHVGKIDGGRWTEEIWKMEQTL